jgi:hypothetical protein
MKYLIWPKSGEPRNERCDWLQFGLFVPSYNRLPCAHYLPVDRAGLLVDMTDSCKSENLDRLLRIYNNSLLDAVVVG